MEKTCIYSTSTSGSTFFLSSSIFRLKNQQSTLAKKWAYTRQERDLIGYLLYETYIVLKHFSCVTYIFQNSKVGNSLLEYIKQAMVGIICALCFGIHRLSNGR